MAEFKKYKHKEIGDEIEAYLLFDIKELVKKEYQEFENQLYQLIDRTEKRNVFGNFVVSKFKKLKEAILDNSNKI